jgi:tetrahydromethanopterin S-methyltransferase subunit C
MNQPTLLATFLGIVMQLAMVLIGKFVPAIGQTPNVYAIAGTVLAALTGAMVARRSAAASAGPVATGGVMAGGLSSVIGGLAAVATDQWPGFAAVQLAFPLISGAVAGGVGALLGRMIRTPVR